MTESPPRRALIVGRFQPFHNGHLEAVARVAREWDEVVVVIGSAYDSHSLKNPFTAGERFEMITGALEDAGVMNARVIPVPDLNRNRLWVSHVTSLVPAIDAFYSNNALPKRLFREAGYEVHALPLVQRDVLEGTRIRELMLAGDDAWEKSVPPAVARVVARVRGIERLKDLSKDDRARRA